MNKLIAVIFPLTLTIIVPTVAFAAGAVPCEQALNDVKAALKSAKLTDAVKAKFTDLENKGIERCKADDDARADAFFAEALAIIGK